MQHLVILIPLVAIVGSFTIVIISIISGVLLKHRREKMWHETARVALEKGQPLPPSPEARENVVTPGSWGDPATFLKFASLDPQAWSNDPAAMTKLAHWKQQRRGRKQLVGGLIMVAVGLGIYATFYLIGRDGDFGNARFVGYFGLIPGFVGVALLIAGLIDVLFPPKIPDFGARPPQS